MPARILEPVIELIKLFGAVVNFESLSKVRWVLKLTPGKRVLNWTQYILCYKFKTSTFFIGVNVITWIEHYKYRIYSDILFQNLYA